MPRLNIDQRIEAEREKLAQQKALVDHLRAQKAKRDRKNLTRKKILIGAVVLNKAQRDPEFKKQLMEWLDKALVEKRDRSLFDFANGSTTTPSNDNLDEQPVSDQDGTAG